MERVQLLLDRDRVSSVYFQSGLRRGDAVWVSRQAATELLRAGVCRWPDGQMALEPEPQAQEPADDPGKAPLTRPPGWPVDRFSVVQTVWRGETVLIVAGGPSVTQQIVDEARGRCRVIAVNNAYEIAPWAEVLYFADHQWWEWHRKRDLYRAFAGQKVTIEGTGERVSEPEVHMLRNLGYIGVSKQPNGIFTGANSGFQAMNIAALSGARKILLLGFDMRFVAGRAHWHAEHPRKTPEASYLRYAKRFDPAKPALEAMGVETVNCSPGSAIKCFRFSEVRLELP